METKEHPPAPPPCPPPEAPTEPEDSQTHSHSEQTQRQALHDLYDPYLHPSDTSLQDARRRLHQALAQTYQLQQAFTERVYGKYLVTLQAPNEYNEYNHDNDPQKVKEEIHQKRQKISQEKAWEKKLPEEDLYVTAGLHLVVDTDTNHHNHHPMKLSQAALAAGQLVVQKSKRNAILRMERQQQNQRLLLLEQPQNVVLDPNEEHPKDPHGPDAPPDYPLLTPTPTIPTQPLLPLDPALESTTTTSRKRKRSTTTHKKGGSKQSLSSSLPILALPELQPDNEDDGIQWPSSGGSSPTLYHPFPDARGGPKQPTPTHKDDHRSSSSTTEPQPQLRLLPKTTRKNHSITTTFYTPLSEQKRQTQILQSLHGTLESFTQSNTTTTTTKLKLLHRLSKEDGVETNHGSLPLLSFQVLHALGLIGRRTTTTDQNDLFPPLPQEHHNHILTKLNKFRECLVSPNNNQRSLTTITQEAMRMEPQTTSDPEALLFHKEDPVSGFPNGAKINISQEATKNGDGNSHDSQDTAMGDSQNVDTLEDAEMETEDVNVVPTSTSETNKMTSSVTVSPTEQASAVIQKQEELASRAVASPPSTIVFSIPSVSPPLLVTQAKNVLQGRIFLVVEEAFDKHPTAEAEVIANAALDYLNTVAAAVPIPKALVLNPLRDRLQSTPGLRNGSMSIPPVPREVIASCILTWLWAQHRACFEDAFKRNGRFDADRSCKWLINAAVDTCVKELALDIFDSMTRGEGAFAEASAARKQAIANRAQVSVPANDPELVVSTRKMEVRTASVVSRSLMTELALDSTLDAILPHFPLFLEYIEEARSCVLKLRARERTLLASLIARKATMAEPFSLAYTSALVQAGEIVGHDNLFEAVQNENLGVSSMMPYDIIADEGEHEWEDPCKPRNGYKENMNAESLVRGAHARAMIQKALRKLQDRHNIRGGVPGSGPYDDLVADKGKTESKESVISTSQVPGPSRGWKRRSSSVAEPPVPAGTGSAAARSWQQYDPNHFSTPLEWDFSLTENSPYGNFSLKERARSVSLNLSSLSEKKKDRSLSISHVPSKRESKAVPRSTHSICWEDVAGIFQDVEVSEKTSSRHGDGSSSNIHHHHHDGVVVDYGSQILAPVCRRLEKLPSTTSTDENEHGSSEEEEDLSESGILARHQVVLDEMKTRLNAFLEARQKYKKRKKKESSPASSTNTSSSPKKYVIKN